MEDHVPRHAQMGAWVLINDRWYYSIVRAFGAIARRLSGGTDTSTKQIEIRFLLRSGISSSSFCLTPWAVFGIHPEKLVGLHPSTSPNQKTK